MRGLRRWMLNVALMVINELLMEKSLITCIISRLIFLLRGFRRNWGEICATNGIVPLRVVTKTRETKKVSYRYLEFFYLDYSSVVAEYFT